MASPETTISGIMDTFKRKIEGGVLPPDPARVLKFALDGPVKIEHVLPLPPLIEKVHHELTVPLIEKLPRLPMTAEFPFVKWEEYKVERW